MQQPAAPAMPIPRLAASRPQSSAGQQAPVTYNVVPQYNNPRHTPPPTGTGQHPNYAPTGVTPQGGMLMPIPRVAPATAGTAAPPGIPVPPRPYQYHAAPSAPVERRAPASGKGGLSGFATMVIIVIVCLIIGGGIYFFFHKTGTQPPPESTIDTTISSIQNVSITSKTDTSATITWKTDKPASSQVIVRDSSDAIVTETELQETLVTSHSVDISGLKPNTTYNYTLISTDAAGHKITSKGELRTLATADKTAPTISGVNVSIITESSAIVTWITDEPATSQVKYEKTEGVSSTTPLDKNLTINHNVTLTKLDSGTTYNFTIMSQDAAGNEATSASNQTFKTLTPIPVGSQVGNLAPPFTLKDINNNEVKLSDFRGKIVMVNFWATWCIPCKDELPFFQAISDNWSEKDLTILAISKEPKGAVRSFINGEGYTFTVLLDSNGEVNTLYGFTDKTSIPRTFFIDAEGIIKKIKVDSFSSKKEIEDILNSLQ
jgi:peroxiredoxin